MFQSSSDDGNDDDELVDEKSSVFLIPEHIMKGIDQVVSSSDPLDEPEFSSINYINSLFSTEQSLYNIDDAIAQMRNKIRNVDSKIRAVVRMQTRVWKVGQEGLRETQQMIRKLFLQTTEIKCKAEESEESVKEITRDIKQLDCIKCNLTSAVTTLNHLHMLVVGIETLRVLTSKRQYDELVMPLQGLFEVIEHFVNYTNIPQVKKLADEVTEVKTVLSLQIIEEYHEALTGSNARNFTPTRRLAEACLVVDVLGPKLKQELLNWIVGVQLNEYLFLFSDCEENGWLDKIDRRYTWFKKHLLQCEDKFGAMFPSHWNLSEMITVEFCEITKSELSKVMSKRAKEIDAKLLLYAIQRTSYFEHLLAVRFNGCKIFEKSGSAIRSIKGEYQKNHNKKPEVNSSLADNPFADEYVGDSESTVTVSCRAPSPFHNIIGECFLPYLYLYIDSLDRNLYDMMDRFVAELKYNQLDSTTVQGVLPSCADLFMIFKKFLAQCHSLSDGPPMLTLCNLFKKYLREYAIKILQNNLPKLWGKSSSSSLCTSVHSITRDLRDISSASSLIQNFLKEGETASFSKVEVSKICCFLTTAEYCLETAQKLEEKLKEKVEPSLVGKINLSQEQDIFHSVISTCIQILVQDLESVCEPALNAMRRIQWQTLESVGDQSAYITALTSNLKTSVPFIKGCLFPTRKYFTQFCIRFTNSFIPKYIHSLYQCGPLSTVGAEQLLLDTHILKTLLLNLPSIGSHVTRKAPGSYTKVVIKGISRGEMILKVVMTPIEPSSSFVDQFFKLLPESDIQEFQKVLEMKGVKAMEKTNLLTVFRQRHSSRLVSKSSVLNSVKHDISSIRKLNDIIKNTSFVENSD